MHDHNKATSNLNIKIDALKKQNAYSVETKEILAKKAIKLRHLWENEKADNLKTNALVG